MRQFILMRALAVLMLASLAFPLFAQSATELSAQAQTAYDRKEYAKSAQLYLQAYKANSKMLTALYNGACSFALAGQKEEALAALEELASQGYNEIDQVKNDSDFKSIHGEPRWEKVVARVGENAKKNPPRRRWVKPYQILDAPTDAAPFKSRLGSATTAVWLEGDILSFLCQSTAQSVRLTGGVQEPMKQIPGSELWIIQIRLPDWDKATVSYGFIEGTSMKPQKVWRGSKAPAEAQKAVPLKGKIVERTIHSEALGEDRKLWIYLPPDAPTKNLPAVFMADGGACPQFAAVLEPLILAHKVRPCAIVGVASGEYKGDISKGYDMNLDMRAKEYIAQADPERFAKHLTFFADEVGAYVAKEFGVSTKREDRAVTGFSNGGAFAASVAMKRPEFFGVSMPLSLGIAPEDPKPTTPMPRLYFAGGTLESFGLHTEDFYKKVKAMGAKATFEYYVAGHDSEMWSLAFSRMMPKVFPFRG